ncbi:MAG: MFS transporter [Chloroflexi bacterium]|nr:MFS transporter [Chloroflexota bacterium]
MPTYPVVKRIERALRFSTYEGMAFGAVQGIGERFTSAYAIALGATNPQLGLLTALPSFIGAFGQTTSARFAGLLGSRKRAVLLFATLSGCMWLPILSVGYVFPSHESVWFIAFFALYTMFGLMTVPVWGSIMAEVVPSQLRGRYFGRRHRWSTFANMMAFLLAGGLLYLFRDRGLVGFALVFGLAFAFRMISVGLLTTLMELPHDQKGEERLSPKAFFRGLHTTNVGRAMLYFFSMNFMVSLASPFFVPYMLRDLGMDYLMFTALEMVSILAVLWAVSHWGAAADLVGNRKMLAIASVLIALVPIVWLVSGNRAYVGFAEFYTGLAWAGFNLVSVNFIYDATPAHKRTAYLGYFNAGAGISTSLGALTGGFLIAHIPTFNGSAILGMFLLSGILRLSMAFLFLPHIKEVRRVRTVPSAELFPIMMGGRVAHRPAHQGRFHLPLSFHRHSDDPNVKGNSP